MKNKNNPIFADEFEPVIDGIEKGAKTDMFDKANADDLIPTKEGYSEKMQFYVKPSTKQKIVAFAKSKNVSYAEAMRVIMEDFISRNDL